MFFLFLIISPQKGPNKIKIKTLESKIQAYSLLEKKSGIEEFLITKKTEIIPQKINKKTHNKLKIVKDLKKEINPNQKYFFENELIKFK